MSCHRMLDAKGRFIGHVCRRNIYECGGYIFEHHDYLGCRRLRKRDWEPASIAGPKFWATVYEWLKLSQEEREKTRAGVRLIKEDE